MFFAALFAAYFTTRAMAPDLWAQDTALLNIPFSSINTTVLVLSSVACQMGVFAAERGQVGRTGGLLSITKWGLREWFVLTYLSASASAVPRSVRRNACRSPRPSPLMKPSSRSRPSAG